MNSMSHRIVNKILEEYKARTVVSRSLHDRAGEALPGGSTRAAIDYTPYPVYMKEGQGCITTDYDGNKYIDLHNNYASLIHGHAHPRTTKAIQEQAEKGTILGAPSKRMFEHAEMLKKRIPGFESVRYCNSGTEATLFAIRAARAFSGRSLLVKTDGAYHGTHDYAEVNIRPDIQNPQNPKARLESAGIPPEILGSMCVVPFNDLEAMDGTLEDQAGKVAAVIIEPMMSAAGQIAPRPGYLQGLRELCSRHGVLLIFDEIVTFRLSEGGMQRWEGVQPDLTAMGKIIGGGLPVGAFGGRKEIMAIFDPKTTNHISHSGTFNGNDMTMAAGIATLADYQQPQIDRLNQLGEKLKSGFNKAFFERGIKAQAIGLGSLVDVHWTNRVIVNAVDAALGYQDADELMMLLHLGMLNRGVFFPRRAQFALSTSLSESHVHQVIEVFADTLDLLLPYIQEIKPQLVA